jgi:hypothetical protein
MSVISESSSVSTKMSELDKKAAAASAALVEKMRAAAEAKAAKAAEKEAEKAKKAAEKEAEKARKAAEKEAEKAKKEAEKEAEKAKKAAEKEAAKASKAAEEAAKPKRPVGRPRKDAASAPTSSASSVVSDTAAPILTPATAFADLREPLPAITPAMRARIAAVDLPDIETYPGSETDTEESLDSLRAENTRLRDQVARLTAALSRQKYSIDCAIEMLSAGC